MPTPAHLPALLRLYGRGGLDPLNAPLIQADLASAAAGLDLQADQMTALGVELHAQSCDALLERFEALLQIVPVGDSALRLAQVVARLTALPDLRPETIEAALEDWTGQDWTLIETTPFFCDDSECDDSVAVVEGALIFIVEIDESDATSADLDRDKIGDYLDDIKPAHVQADVRATGFDTDSAWSLTDIDTLGL